MSGSASQPSLHVAGFYQTDGFLAERVASFITEGLTAGEQVIVLATASHCCKCFRSWWIPRVQRGRVL